MSGSCKFVCPAALALDDAYRPRRTLGFWRLLGILYMVTSCGAYATEPMVEAGGGPLLCIIGLLVLPCLWGIPTALGVAELATAMPSNGGVLIWINCAYPPTVTCTMAACTIFMSMVDNAIYPCLCVDYLMQVLLQSPSPHSLST